MSLSLEVASTAERECTGYAGALSLTYRYNIYRIEVMNDGTIRKAMRNGENVSSSSFSPSTIKLLAQAAANYFPVKS